jgi:signal transduction histidine kinase
LEGLLENSISHGLKDVENGNISIHITNTSNELTILFKDNGPGIPPDIREKIFEPFFTTSRGSIENSGLGLYAIENIVTNLFHGKLELKPGTCFELCLTLPTDG